MYALVSPRTADQRLAESPMSEDALFYAALATRCSRLVGGCNDKRLAELGREFTEKALRLGAAVELLPDEWRSAKMTAEHTRPGLGRTTLPGQAAAAA